ncbi:hypothetical protein BIW11_07056 [Tropilaelaps mercedesae]|uniref:Uncharacterized protein n=1 Tax=Tropilaelaps mercedesae TaxID=418985 RepID=A0A1V9XVW7_9ACAR|nr:hypothetical protein BIW11_07056 [Tropilaelaps mercedesae]
MIPMHVVIGLTVGWLRSTTVDFIYAGLVFLEILQIVTRISLETEAVYYEGWSWLSDDLSEVGDDSAVNDSGWATASHSRSHTAEISAEAYPYNDIGPSDVRFQGSPTTASTTSSYAISAGSLSATNREARTVPLSMAERQSKTNVDERIL